MGKLYRYELHRLMLSKFYLGLLVILLWYGWQELGTVTILGVCNTAPFSPWSFGSFLSQLQSVLCIALLFFLWNQCRPSARQVESLSSATATDPRTYRLIKILAAATAWLVLACLAAALGLVFLASLFASRFSAVSLLLPTALTLLPPAIFFFGLGLLVGLRRPALLFALMALALGLGYAPLPLWADVYGKTLFTYYPSSLGMLDPPFCLPEQALWGKVSLAALGLTLLLLCLRRSKHVQ